MEREITFYVYLTGIRRQTIDIVREATQTIKYLHKACNPYRIVSQELISSHSYTYICLHSWVTLFTV